jgi:uncharacterized membrane protein YcaP (DUF421 family)
MILIRQILVGKAKPVRPISTLQHVDFAINLAIGGTIVTTTLRLKLQSYATTLVAAVNVPIRLALKVKRLQMYL